MNAWEFIGILMLVVPFLVIITKVILEDGILECIAMLIIFLFIVSWIGIGVYLTWGSL